MTMASRGTFFTALFSKTDDVNFVNDNKFSLNFYCTCTLYSGWQIKMFSIFAKNSLFGRFPFSFIKHACIYSLLHTFILYRILWFRHPSYPLSSLSCMQSILHTFILSCILCVHLPSCPACSLSCILPVQHTAFPASLLSSMQPFLHPSCPVCSLSCSPPVRMQPFLYPSYPACTVINAFGGLVILRAIAGNITSYSREIYSQLKSLL